MTTDTVGGVWNYCVQLSRALREHDVHVVLATMGAPLSDSQRAQASALDNVELRESTFRLEWMDEPWDDVERAGDWLLDIENGERPDIVHLNGYAHGRLPWSVPALVVGHSCVLSWWRAVRGRDAPAAWNAYRAAVRAGLRAAQLVVAPTRAMLTDLTTYYGTLPHGLVIPNGCDADTTQSMPLHSSAPHSRTAGSRKQPASSSTCDAVVLAAGRLWDESKNIATLAAAADLIRGNVCVAGSDEHPVQGRIPLSGVRALGLLAPDALRRWYRRAAVFVHPASYEPFGLAPLEAALQGCPLVLGDIPSLREVWGDAAVFVPPRDAAALAAAVNRLLDNPHTREAAARAAFARARTYTAARMAQGYQAAYRTLALRAAMLKGAVACA